MSSSDLTAPAQRRSKAAFQPAKAAFVVSASRTARRFPGTAAPPPNWAKAFRYGYPVTGQLAAVLRLPAPVPGR